MHNKHIKNRPQKAWAGLATARLLCGRYIYLSSTLRRNADVKLAIKLNFMGDRTLAKNARVT